MCKDRGVPQYTLKPKDVPLIIPAPGTLMHEMRESFGAQFDAEGYWLEFFEGEYYRLCSERGK